MLAVREHHACREAAGQSVHEGQQDARHGELPQRRHGMRQEVVQLNSKRCRSGSTGSAALCIIYVFGPHLVRTSVRSFPIHSPGCVDK